MGIKQTYRFLTSTLEQDDETAAAYEAAGGLIYRLIVCHQRQKTNASFCCKIRFDWKAMGAPMR